MKAGKQDDPPKTFWLRWFKRGKSPSTVASVQGEDGRAAQEAIERLAIVEALYRETYGFALEQRARASWFQQVAIELARPPLGWRRWLPYWRVQRRVVRRLARFGIFDADGYLNRYPDVAVSRNDPVYHFLQHGLSEQRDGGVDFAPLPHIQPATILLPAILSSGLFDPDWYARQYNVSGTPLELLQNYLATSVKDPLRDPGPLFSGIFYTLENPDTRGVQPLEHYVGYGMREGRRAFRASAADRFMADAPDTPLPGMADYLAAGRKVAVLHWDKGNFFFTDIARYVTEAIAALGFEVTMLTDHAGLDLDGMEIVVVAPHEYCVHGPGAHFPAGVAARAVHINTEQWHTSWFSLALDKMLASRRALDINPLSARGLSRLGIHAGFLPLLPRANGIFDFKQAPLSRQVTDLRAVKPLTFPARFADRPYDILFAGALNNRRARALAKLAPVLSGYDCFLHAPRLHGPVTPDNPNMIGSTDLAQLAKNAKILLNIHQGDSHYFEWHRLVLTGIAQGCVPVTEPCSDIGMVRPGEHYVAVPIDEMADRIAWLLDTAAGQRELARLHENGRALMAKLGRM